MTIGQAQLDSAFKLAESGKVNEALAMIDQVIATDPNNWRSYFLKSAVLILAKRGDEALKQIDTSINLARRSNVSAGLLAELYESKARSCIDYGRYDEAKKSLEQAVHLQPTDPTTLNDLAWMLATSKDLRVRDGRRAVAIATKACTLSNWKNAFSIDTLAAASAHGRQFCGRGQIPAARNLASGRGRSESSNAGHGATASSIFKRPDVHRHLASTNLKVSSMR